MDSNKHVNSVVKVALPLLLGGAILYWMYRDFDFGSIREVLTNEMNWTWMVLSLPFGILAQAFRSRPSASIRASGSACSPSISPTP